MADERVSLAQQVADKQAKLEGLRRKRQQVAQDAENEVRDARLREESKRLDAQIEEEERLISAQEAASQMQVKVVEGGVDTSAVPTPPPLPDVPEGSNAPGGAKDEHIANDDTEGEGR